VWTTDEQYAMNVNEAQAYASCENCAAVAVAYQVVFVIDRDEAGDNVAVPQNLAGALNYDCLNCMTYALARQLFVTLDEELSAEARDELDALWAEIAAYGEEIAAGRADVNGIDARLADYTRQIMVIVEQDQPGTFPTELYPSLTRTVVPGTSTAASPTSSGTATPDTPASGTATATASPSATAETATPEATAPEPTTSSAPTTSAATTSSAATPTDSPTPEPGTDTVTVRDETTTDTDADTGGTDSAAGEDTSDSSDAS
jgi:putative peptide zinc metalloprotease protein